MNEMNEMNEMKQERQSKNKKCKNRTLFLKLSNVLLYFKTPSGRPLGRPPGKREGRKPDLWGNWNVRIPRFHPRGMVRLGIDWYINTILMPTYTPDEGRYLQLVSAKDLYIQNVTVVEHVGHSGSFQIKFPKVFTNYPLGTVRVENQKFKDWDHYKFTLWQSQFNFMVFCASSACDVSVEHMNAKKPIIRSIYRIVYMIIVSINMIISTTMRCL